MASQVQICNLALARIGQRSIASMGEASNEAAFCTTFYDSVRRALLRAHPWSFARKVASLALSSEDAEYGYAYRYVLPTDCLRPLELTNLANGGRTSTFDTDAGGKRVGFKVVNRDLLANMENAKLAYTGNAEDPNLFDDAFIQAFSYRLAADLAGVLTDNSTFQSNMIQLFEQTLAEAKKVDSAAGVKDEPMTVVSVRA